MRVAQSQSATKLQKFYAILMRYRPPNIRANSFSYGHICIRSKIGFFKSNYAYQRIARALAWRMLN